MVIATYSHPSQNSCCESLNLCFSPSLSSSLYLSLKINNIFFKKLNGI